jgi:phosphatidylethanolamine/phosphatidyl-N-methylethanolamine N-methyltransferase
MRRPVDDDPHTEARDSARWAAPPVSTPDSSGPALGERLLFWRSWLRNPSRVGAIAPSGRALARLMTARITAADWPVIELGPGTGTFTRALLARGVPEHRLALVEADPAF